MEENIRKRMCDNLTSLQGSIMRDEPREVVRELMKRFTEDYELVYGQDIPESHSCLNNRSIGPSTIPDEPIAEVPPKKSLKRIFADCIGKY